MSKDESLRAEVERRAAEDELRRLDPRHSSQWTPAVVTAMITSTLATIGTIVGLIVNRPTPPPNMAGVAQRRDVDAVEQRAADAAQSAADARDDLKACRSQFKGLDQRVRSLENPRGTP